MRFARLVFQAACFIHSNYALNIDDSASLKSDDSSIQRGPRYVAQHGRGIGSRTSPSLQSEEAGHAGQAHKRLAKRIARMNGRLHQDHPQEDEGHPQQNHNHNGVQQRGIRAAIRRQLRRIDWPALRFHGLLLATTVVSNLLSPHINSFFHQMTMRRAERREEAAIRQRLHELRGAEPRQAMEVQRLAQLIAQHSGYPEREIMPQILRTWPNVNVRLSTTQYRADGIHAHQQGAGMLSGIPKPTPEQERHNKDSNTELRRRRLV